MNVLHVNSYFSASTFYKNLYDEQIKSGLDISVYVPISEDIDYKRDLGEYTLVSKAYSKIDRIFFYRKHTKIVQDIQKKIDIKNFDILHAHSLFSNGYVAMKLKEKYNIPYIVAVRNTDLNIFFKKMLHLRKLGIKILKNADQIIFLSESYKKQCFEKYVPGKYLDVFEKKVSVIPNGLDNFWLKNKYYKDKIDDKSINLLFIGAINKNKNITASIEVMKLLKEEGKSVKLTVVGEIQDKKIFNLIEKNSDVTYVSPKKKEKLIEIYRAHDIFVMPSIYESFGLVYAEAMSQGLPVIYSQGQGFDCQFPNGEVGYSVNSLDYEDIKNGILKSVKFSKDDILRITNNSENFNWKNISDRYTKIYKNIIVRKS